MNKYLVANIHNNNIVVCSVVKEKEVKDAIRWILKLASQIVFDIDGTFYDGCSGFSKRLENGTTLQVMYIP